MASDDTHHGHNTITDLGTYTNITFNHPDIELGDQVISGRTTFGCRPKPSLTISATEVKFEANESEIVSLDFKTVKDLLAIRDSYANLKKEVESLKYYLSERITVQATFEKLANQANKSTESVDNMTASDESIVTPLG